MASFLCNENTQSEINNQLSPVVDLTSDAESSFSDSFQIKRPTHDNTPISSPAVQLQEIQADISTTTPATPSEDEIRRQLEESERLAWELMQQESMEAYNSQLEFMRENSEAMDPADLEALEHAMAEERRALVEPEESQVELEENSEEWSYDRLLQLGQALGGISLITSTCLLKAPLL